MTDTVDNEPAEQAPAPVMTEPKSEAAPEQSPNLPAAAHSTGVTMPLKPAAAPVPPDGSKEGEEKKLSKRDQIRKRLREKEKQLADLVNRRNLNGRGLLSVPAVAPAAQKSPEKGVSDVDLLIIDPGDKDEADRKEAVKVLSQAAVSLNEKLQKQKDEATGLQKQLESLDSTLQTREEEKVKLETELQALRQEVETNQAKMKNLEEALEERQSTLSSLEQGHEEYKEKEKDLQNQLSAAYEEVVWTQKDSMSKAEQIEYFEYELLAKNQEVDDLKQELNERLRRIVELEIDLEIHDDRFSTPFDDDQSETGTTKSSDAGSVASSIVSAPSPRGGGPQKRRSGLGAMLKRRKRGRKKEAAMVIQNMDLASGNPAVEKVQAELASLEARYKKDKYNSRMQIEQLKQESNEHLIKVLDLEKSLQRAGESDPNQEEKVGDAIATAEKSNDTSKAQEAAPNKARFLQERVEKLEIDRALQDRTVQKLREEMAQLKAEATSRAEKDRVSIEKLKLENESKSAKIAALEHELRSTVRAGTDSSLQALHLNTASLETKINDQFSEVVRLRKELEVKERKIEVLRSEIIELRLLRMQYEKATAQEPSSGKTGLESINEEGGVGGPGSLRPLEDKLAWTQEDGSDRHAPIEQDVLSRINEMSLDNTVLTGDIRLQYHV